MRHCFLQVKAWQGIAGDLSVVLCEGRPAQLSCASPGVVLEADGRRGGVLQDVHQVPELLADVQVEPFGCHDGSAAARVAIKQSPVVEIKTLPALWGERGRFSECREEADDGERGVGALPCVSQPCTDTQHRLRQLVPRGQPAGARWPVPPSASQPQSSSRAQQLLWLSPRVALTPSSSPLPSPEGWRPLGLGLLSTNTTSQHAWSSLCWLFPAFITLQGGKEVLRLALSHPKYQVWSMGTPENPTLIHWLRTGVSQAPGHGRGSPSSTSPPCPHSCAHPCSSQGLPSRPTQQQQGEQRSQTWSSGSARSPCGEVAKKRWPCCRSPPLPQAEKMPETLQQPQHTHSQPGLRHCEGILASSPEQHRSEGAGGSEGRR